ncbi:MAG: flagellar M-ring protein FliF [Rhodobacteraceae bacterium]|nr:flagellar M-ring protein FliF [Paracoccaceae bacterium]
MNQVAQKWLALEPGKKAVAVLAVLATVLAVLWLGRMAAAPSMSLLYAGLDPVQSGEVLQALDQRVARYEIRGDSIYVESTERDRLRMALAGDGLPTNSGKGYELLDSLTGFGTTSQMFDAAYWRAKEGELARTILSNPMVRQARVHIATPQSTPFDRTGVPTASVTVLARGGQVSEQNANSFRFLVASAVRGLTPENVAVIDAASGKVVSGTTEDQTALADNRAAGLKRNVERLLFAHVGPGNAVVEVSVDTVTESESITERTIDPKSRVAISTDVEEVTSTESNAGPGGVTVASNLPDGDAAAGDGRTQSQNSETREITNFEISEMTREVVRRPGSVRRISVAVLVNGASAQNGESLNETELADIRELVASTIGYDEARGDQITIKSMPFEPIEALGTSAEAGLFGAFNFNPFQLGQALIFALVALVLGLFVVRPVLRGTAGATAALPSPASGSELLGTAAAGAAGFGGTGEVLDGTVMTADGSKAPGGDAIPALPGTGTGTGGLMGDAAPEQLPATPSGELRQLIEDRQADTIEILRSWIEDDTPSEVH